MQVSSFSECPCIRVSQRPPPNFQLGSCAAVQQRYSKAGFRSLSCPKPWWDWLGASIFSGTTTKNKNGSGTPKGAQTAESVSGPRRPRRICPARRHTRRGLAFRRPTAALAAATECHRSAPAHALPGTDLGRARCYLAPAVLQCSGTIRRQVVLLAGRLVPEPPGSDGDGRRAREPLSPLTWKESPDQRPQSERVALKYLSEGSVNRRMRNNGSHLCAEGYALFPGAAQQ